MTDVNQNQAANAQNPNYNDQYYNYAAAAESNYQSPTNKQKGSLTQVLAIVLSVLVVVSGVVGGVYFYNQTNVSNSSSNSNQVLGTYDANKWSAIFLINGQVYFGKILEKTQNEMIVEDVYFLNVVQRPVGIAEGEDQQQFQNAEPELTLVERTNTLHKPTGQIILNMSNVLFTEDLTPESQVIEAIEAMKNTPEE